MNIEHEYLRLLKDILDNGVEKEDRTGTGTISVFGRQIRHSMSEGFPALTTKKLAFKTMVTELLWFLQGRTDLRYLLENGCHIWTGDAYKVYDKDFDAEYPPFSGPYPSRLTMQEFEQKIMDDDEFNRMYGDLGPIYGKQWREWEAYEKHPNMDGVYHIHYIDQIQNLIKDLKTNPDSRRLMVSAWNPADLQNQVLPPCHYGFQVYTRELSYKERYNIWFSNNYETGMERNYDIIPDFDNDYYELTPKRAISLMFNMRSNDVPLGLPFNITSYGLLLEIFGKMVNMVPDELIANLGDAHIYKNQIDGVKEQLTREPHKLATLNISDEVNFKGSIDDFLTSCTKDSFKLDSYISHSPIKMPLSN